MTAWTPPTIAAPDIALVDRRRGQTAIVAAAFLAAIAGLLAMWLTLRPSSASFSDEEIIERNRLGTGTVDIEVGDQTVAFAATNMAAGDSASGQLVLENSGTLPLLFVLTSFAPESPLRDQLRIDAWLADATCPTTAPDDAVAWTVLDESAPETGRSGALATGESQLVCISATLPITATSEAQGQRLDLIIGIDAVHDIAASNGEGQ